MGFHTKSANDVHTVWNHTFKWTDKHFTPEDLLPLRQQADDLAADSVTKLQAITAKEKEDNPNAPPGRVDMYGVLEKHHAEDEVLQKIWDEVNTVPDWVDWAQIERGQQFLYRYLVPNLTGLALQGFLGGTAVRSHLRFKQNHTNDHVRPSPEAPKYWFALADSRSACSLDDSSRLSSGYSRSPSRCDPSNPAEKVTSPPCASGSSIPPCETAS